MSVTIPKNIAQHMLIKKHLPINYDIKHIIDSTGPHAGQNKKERLEKLKKYINRDTSHYLPKFKHAVEFKKIQARQNLGRILATSTGSRSSGSSSSSSSTTPKGAGKRRRKTKRKKRKTKRRHRRRTRRKRARHRIKKEERNTHPAVMDEDKVIVDNKFLEKVVADIKKGEKTLKKRKKTRKRNIKANASGVAMYDSKKASGNSNIKKGLEYAEKLVGIKWQYKAPSEDSCPFWNRDGPPPSMQGIKKGGLSCVGVTNLIRRHLGLKIPTESGKWKDLFPGGTGAWFNYLKEKKRLQKINYSKTYPKGTLLLEDWNPKNDGHVAIVWTENKKGLSHSKILHGRHDGPKSVVIEPLDNYTMKKRFTHVCLPENWLAKN